MSEIVNLRRALKQKALAEAEDAAAANRIAHGRTKAEKTLSKAKSDLAAKRLESHKRDHGDD